VFVIWVAKCRLGLIFGGIILKRSCYPDRNDNLAKTGLNITTAVRDVPS
jgi:hypothetical protein